MIFSARLKGGQKTGGERGIRHERAFARREPVRRRYAAAGQPTKKSRALAEFFRMSASGINKKAQNASLA